MPLSSHQFPFVFHPSTLAPSLSSIPSLLPPPHSFVAFDLSYPNSPLSLSVSWNSNEYSPDTPPQLTGFGVFQEYYTTAWLPSYTTSDISWIGGVQYMFELGLGPVAGRL